MISKNDDFVFYEYHNHAVLHKYLGSSEKVVVPAFSPQGKLVTELGSNAFSFNRTIRSVIIPESCTTIGCGCFDGAYQLSTVCANIPEKTDTTVHSIFPRNVRRIEYRAFAGTALESAIFCNDNEMEICEYAFSDCYQLDSVSLPNCKSIILGDGAFMRSNIRLFTASRSSIYISSYGFAYCSSLLTFCAQHINHIEDHAFYCCRNLKKFSPKVHMSYERSVFDGCISLRI